MQNKFELPACNMQYFQSAGMLYKNNGPYHSALSSAHAM